MALSGSGAPATSPGVTCRPLSCSRGLMRPAAWASTGTLKQKCALRLQQMEATVLHQVSPALY